MAGVKLSKLRQWLLELTNSNGITRTFQTNKCRITEIDLNKYI